MKHIYLAIVLFAVSTLLLSGMGCSDDERTEVDTTNLQNSKVGSSAINSQGLNTRSSETITSTSFPPSTLIQTGDYQSGIWVTGEGSLNLEPDLALVNIGVETQALSVARARKMAGNAMDSVVKVVKGHGLVDRDIKTISFNILPQYEYTEISESGRRVHKQILIGYKVNNTARIKVRDLEKIGTIIDDVANAGGDSTRITGITFTVEDLDPFMSELRKMAVEDAISKAQHLALLSGIEIDKLIFVGELDQGSTPLKNFGSESGFAMVRSAPAITSISGGELEFTSNVQAIFSIR